MNLPFAGRHIASLLPPFTAVIRSHLHRGTPIRSKSTSPGRLLPSSPIPSSEEAGFNSPPQEISQNTGVKKPEILKGQPLRSPADFGEKDLASEESLWSLYERWMAHYADEVPKDLDKKGKSFERFKKNARHVHEFNKNAGNSFTICLNMFAASDPNVNYGYIPSPPLKINRTFIRRPPFDFGEKDLASEESLWSLYERWMAYYRYDFVIPKDLDKKGESFDTFKKNAKYVHEFNKNRKSSSTMILNVIAASHRYMEDLDYLDIEDETNFEEAGIVVETSDKLTQ